MSNLVSLETFTKDAAVQWILDNTQDCTGAALAQTLDIHNVHIYQAIKHRTISPTLKRAMIAKGIFAPKPQRRRYACDIPGWLNDEQARWFRLQMKAAAAVAMMNMRREREWALPEK